MPTMTSTRSALLAVGCVAALALGCSSGGDSTSAPPVDDHPELADVFFQGDASADELAAMLLKTPLTSAPAAPGVRTAPPPDSVYTKGAAIPTFRWQLEDPSGAPAHEKAGLATRTYITFGTDFDADLVRVFTSGESFTPDADAWKKLSVGTWVAGDIFVASYDSSDALQGEVVEGLAILFLLEHGRRRLVAASAERHRLIDAGAPRIQEGSPTIRTVTRPRRKDMVRADAGRRVSGAEHGHIALHRFARMPWDGSPMTLLASDADRVVRDAVDGYLAGRKEYAAAARGETIFETRNSRYRLLDGVLFAAGDTSMLGAEFVGWLLEGLDTCSVQAEWMPGARAILVDPRKGQNIIVTSTTRACQTHATRTQRWKRSTRATPSCRRWTRSRARCRRRRRRRSTRACCRAAGRSCRARPRPSAACRARPRSPVATTLVQRKEPAANPTRAMPPPAAPPPPRPSAARACAAAAHGQSLRLEGRGS